MVSVDQRRAGSLGNMPGKLETEEFTLAVDDIGLPFDELADQRVAVGYGHAHVRIDHAQRDGLDVIYGSVPVCFQTGGEGQDPDLMATLYKLLAKVAYGGDYAVGIGDK